LAQEEETLLVSVKAYANLTVRPTSQTGVYKKRAGFSDPLVLVDEPAFNG